MKKNRKYPKVREIKEALRALFKGPVTIDYPKKAHTPYPKFRGRPVPDEKECIACGACAHVCPAGAIEIKEDLTKKHPSREIIWHLDRCIFCGQCERLCTTKKGVTLSPEYDLACFDRSTLKAKVEQELVVCECCGEVIAPKAQLLWLIKKLGPLASGNFNLVYTEQNELNVSKETPSERPAEKRERGDLYRVLCPKCRHLVLSFNQTGKQP